MFERYTDAARRVLVLANQEAAIRNHRYVGTEHILLGLVREGESVAARVLDGLDISMEQLEDKVEELRPRRLEPLEGSPPFTPDAMRALEFALREAVVLDDHYIGPEHLLLGIIRKSDCVGARALYELGPDLGLIRHEVMRRISGDDL